MYLKAIINLMANLVYKTKKNDLAIKLPPPHHTKYSGITLLSSQGVKEINNDLNPLVSVIMPVRNGEKYLERAIDSILSQNYGNIEIIIADGLSSDGTIKILNKYKEKISFFSEKDDGPADAINKCLDVINGLYMTLVLADDSIEHDYISKMVKAIHQTRYDFVYGDLNLYDDNNKYLYLVKGHRNYKKNIRYKFTTNPPAIMYSRKYINKVGYQKLIDVAPDYEWILRAHNMGFEGVYCKDARYNFFLGGNSSKNVYSGYSEVRKISILYNGNFFFAWLYYVQTVGRHIFRDLMIGILGGRFVLILRKLRRRIINSIS